MPKKVDPEPKPVKKSYKNIYFGFAFSYNTSNQTVTSYSLIGYRVFNFIGFGVVPAVGFSLPGKVDLFAGITYNMFDWVDIGASVSVLNPALNLTVGKNF